LWRRRGLAEDVEKLLAATEKRGDFMEASALESESRAFDVETGEGLIGGLVGKYRLLRLIGRRGMGRFITTSRTDFKVFLFDKTELMRDCAAGFAVKIGQSCRQSLRSNQSSLAFPVWHLDHDQAKFMHAQSKLA